MTDDGRAEVGSTSFICPPSSFVVCPRSVIRHLSSERRSNSVLFRNCVRSVYPFVEPSLRPTLPTPACGGG